MEILECGPERPVGSSMWGCNQKAGRGILSHKKLNTHTRLPTVDDIGNGKQALRQTETFKISCSQNSRDNWKRSSKPMSQTNIKPNKRPQPQPQEVQRPKQKQALISLESLAVRPELWSLQIFGNCKRIQKKVFSKLSQNAVNHLLVIARLRKYSQTLNSSEIAVDTFHNLYIETSLRNRL